MLPASEIVGIGLAAERRVRGTLSRSAERLLVRSLDATLGSHLAQVAVDRVLGSALAEHAVSVALRGPLVEAIARESVRHRVIERAAEPLAGDPEIERIVSAAFDAPAARRLVAQVIESGVVDEAVARLLESEDLWILVDEIARSPAVTDAISHQSAGLADQVAEVVRDRSRSADARLERAARRLLGRSAVETPVDGE